jgi:hypothetical protein
MMRVLTRAGTSGLSPPPHPSLAMLDVEVGNTKRGRVVLPWRL